MIQWNEQFNTGSDAIDQQHQTLINYVNNLECLLNDANPSREALNFLVRFVNYLESYTETHFKFEEDCMERHGCPVHEKNKQAHERFMSFFQQFKEEFQSRGFQPDDLRILHQTINEWIQEHILRVDTRLKPCLKVVNRA